MTRPELINTLTTIRKAQADKRKGYILDYYLTALQLRGETAA